MILSDFGSLRACQKWRRYFGNIKQGIWELTDQKSGRKDEIWPWKHILQHLKATMPILAQGTVALLCSMHGANFRTMPSWCEKLPMATDSSRDIFGLIFSM